MKKAWLFGFMESEPPEWALLDASRGGCVYRRPPAFEVHIECRYCGGIDKESRRVLPVLLLRAGKKAGRISASLLVRVHADRL